MPKRAVRIQPELDQRMQNATKERGYRSPSAFIRAAIESELKSRSDRAGMEEQTAASFDQMAKEFRRVLRGQQAILHCSMRSPRSSWAAYPIRLPKRGRNRSQWREIGICN